jgi:ATP-dependent Clp protease protease subunit
MNFEQKTYENLLEERKILLNHDIDNSVIEKIVMQIIAFNEHDNKAEQHVVDYKRPEINLYLNTFGGSVYNAFSVIDAISASKTSVNTIALSQCMSAGFLILVSGHKRYCYPHSMLMYHDCSLKLNADYNNFMSTASNLTRVREQYLRLITSKCDISRKMLVSIADKKHDWYVDSREALKYKFVDEVIR